jgi:Tfp pilus assembly protein PilE
MSVTSTAAGGHDARSRARGVTIIEAMVALIVVAVVVTLAAPSMRGMMARQRVQAVQADLLTDLQLARSEVVQRNAEVALSFGANADVSCYTLHVKVTGVACDCTRGPGSACTPATTPPPEIKTSQMMRADGVGLSASSPSGSRIDIAPPRGAVTPTDMVIDVQGAISGHLRTTINGLGVATVCTPDGSMRGVPPCP